MSIKCADDSKNDDKKNRKLRNKSKKVHSFLKRVFHDVFKGALSNAF